MDEDVDEWMEGWRDGGPQAVLMLVQLSPSEAMLWYTSSRWGTPGDTVDLRMIDRTKSEFDSTVSKYGDIGCDHYSWTAT